MVEDNWIMVNTMNEIKNNKKDKMMIAFYQRPYNKKSVKKIKDIITQRKPDHIVLLSIVEQKESSGTIDSYLGRKDVKRLQDQSQNAQEIRSIRYTDKILKIIEELKISTEIVEKKGDIIEVIKNEFNRVNPDILIINHSHKSRVDKFLSGCVEDDIIGQCSNIIIV